MIVLYGLNSIFKNITNHFNGNVVFIPKDDNARAKLFGDPVFGKVKIIVIIDDYENVKIIENNTAYVLFKDINGKFNIDYTPDWKTVYDSNIYNIHDKLSYLHSVLKLNYGTFNDEYPEQRMAMSYIHPDSRVLELGANIGRNSCIIASILSDSRNLVSLEPVTEYSNQLTHNRDINKLKFHVENSALSKQPLIQKGWQSKPSNVIEDGWSSIPIIDWKTLNQKYNLQFDVLVADCEGALYYIFQEFPEILNQISTIIVENDYRTPEHRLFVENLYLQHGFKPVYTERCEWLKDCSWFPNASWDCFFQVWKK